MAKMYSCMLLFMLITVFVGTIATDYCNLKCPNNYIHTMCKYRSPEPSPNCGKWRKVGLSEDEKQEILRVHNAERRKVAAGKETRGNPGPQPAAKNIPDLAWDDELETIAQRWANQCDFNHDKCKNVERFHVGQNIGYGEASPGSDYWKVGLLVEDWISEVEQMDRNNDIDVFPSHKLLEIGHYTQVVADRTKLIGCGRIYYQPLGNDMESCLLVCNYGPSGNFLGQPVYIRA